MAESPKRQAIVAGVVLLLLMSVIIYFLISVEPIVKIIPVKQAIQSIEAERRAKELEEKLLKSSDVLPPGP